MDDEIKKMLIEGYKKTDPEEFEREVARLFITAQENTNHVYKCLMEEILKEYQATPLEDPITVLFKFYNYNLMLTMDSSVLECYQKSFTYNIIDLNSACKKEYGNEIFWTKAGPCLISLLRSKIEKDGWTFVIDPYNNHLIEISTDEFRRVMNKFIAEDNQKRR